jgi:hypothetical protein
VTLEQEALVGGTGAATPHALRLDAENVYWLSSSLVFDTDEVRMHAR